MDLLILLICLWIQVGFVPGIHHEDGAYLPRKDVLLFKDKKDPKCFTRTLEDFTCFFETPDNRSYDFFYNVGDGEKRCDMYVQRTEEGTVLHVCSFPTDDVFSYILTHLKVVESSTNTILFTHSISVEDQVLLDPPVDVSLHHTDKAGQLQVAWHIEKKWENRVRYQIRYSSKRLEEKTKVGERREVIRLESLVPAEMLQLQIRVSADNSENWSHWTDPVFAMVPQRADDISLMCYTSDLQNVTCQWNENTYGEYIYKLFYKIGLSRAADWKECVSDGILTDRCYFHGDESQSVQVKLSNASTPFSRTFYTEPFTLTHSIKTSPPQHLRGKLESGRLCLTWAAPPLALSAHLQYQVSYQLRQDAAWVTVFVKGPETETCIEVLSGQQYRIRVSAKPLYSGHWSDWSQELTGDIPSDTGVLLILCIPVMLFIVAIIFISLYFSKLKQYLWPPVPNLDKVLQGFLTDINKQTWDPPFTAKQLSEEIPASVVVVMSVDEVLGLGNPSGESGQLLSSEADSFSGEQEDGSPEGVSPDYVTLNTNGITLCPKGNEYVYEEVGECGDAVLQTTCHCSYSGSSFSIPSCSSSDLLNHSYLPLAESADKLHCQVAATRGPGNLYVNSQGSIKANS